MKVMKVPRRFRRLMEVTDSAPIRVRGVSDACLGWCRLHVRPGCDGHVD